METVSSIFAVNSLVFQKKNLKGIFVGPYIGKFISDDMFKKTMWNVERETRIAL
jgi:hypothetical protein